MTLSFNQAYKEWRNKARGYSLLSIIDCAISVLHADSASKIDDLRKAPWHVLLIVKWACQDRMNRLSFGNSISQTEFDRLRQSLWDLSDRFDVGITVSRPAQLFFRQLIRPQIDFQKKDSLNFVREAALLCIQEKNSRLRLMFSEKTGLSVEDFIDLSVAITAIVISDGKIFDASKFSSLRAAYGEGVDRFVDLIALDANGVLDFFRAIPDANQKVASEFYEFPAISRYPFLKIGQRLVCWHKSVFFRGMENIVHSIMSENGQEYMRDFTRLFERHVVSQSKLIPCPFFDEDVLRGWLPAGSKVPDGLLSFDRVNVFVESKAGMFDESIKVVGNADIFMSKTRMLQKAIEQARSASVGLRASPLAPDAAKNSEIDYLLIVTNKEISVSRGDRLAAMCGCDFAGDEGYLSLVRVYVMSIDDFERMIAGIFSGKRSLPDFLRSCVARDSAPETAVFLFSQHLDADGFPASASEIVGQALNNANQRLAIALGHES